jgi:uncharacterized membrane protein YdbT with pleckstrin-like domain
MESDQSSSSDYNHPVAYDAEGKPLYAHPPLGLDNAIVSDEATKTEQSNSSSAHDITDEIKLKHARSMTDHPGVSLGDDEYIVAAVLRHPIGLVAPIIIGTFLVSIILIILFNYDLIVQSLQLTGGAATPATIILPVVILIGLVILVTYAVCYVYTNNKLFLTNSNVILKTQLAPFAEREQIVGLANIEDVSYSQSGIIQKLFDYGSIQLTIEGYGTVYQFSYAARPRKYMVIFDNTIENFQNHHPNRKNQ